MCLGHSIRMSSPNLVFATHSITVEQTCVLPLPFVFLLTVPARLNLVAASSVCRAELCVIGSYALVFLQTWFLQLILVTFYLITPDSTRFQILATCSIG